MVKHHILGMRSTRMSLNVCERFKCSNELLTMLHQKYNASQVDIDRYRDNARVWSWSLRLEGHVLGDQRRKFAVVGEMQAAEALRLLVGAVTDDGGVPVKVSCRSSAVTSFHLSALARAGRRRESRGGGLDDDDASQGQSLPSAVAIRPRPWAAQKLCAPAPPMSAPVIFFFSWSTSSLEVSSLLSVVRLDASASS